MNRAFKTNLLVASLALLSNPGSAAGQSRLGALSFAGVTAREEAALLRACPVRPGAPLDSLAVARALEGAVRYFADRGFPFCSVRLSRFDPGSDGRAAVELTVERGRFIRIGEVRLKNDGATRPGVVRRIARLREGEPYSESRMEEAAGRLLASGLFRRVAGPELRQGASRSAAVAELTLEEYPANRLEAALGTGSGGISGLVRVSLNNLFGTARSAHIDWQRPRRDWASLALAWREPWLACRDLALEANFSQQVRDSLFTDTGGRIEVSTELAGRLRAGVGAAYREASPGSETFAAAESSRWWAVTGRLEWRNVLRPLNPARGFELALEASAGTRNIEGTAGREYRSRVSAALYLPLAGTGGQLAALSGGFALVARGNSTPAEIPWHARIPVGGVLRGWEGAPVRGHLEEETRGRRVGWASLEYRYLVGENSRLFAFYDAGAVLEASSRRSPAEWTTRWLEGAGAGLQIDSRAGLIRLALGFDPGRGLSEGRLHIDFVEKF